MNENRMITEQDIKKLFMTLSAIYGHSWKSLFQTNSEWSFTRQVWLKGLKFYPASALSDAVDSLLTKHRDYPPTLGQLVDACDNKMGIPCFEEAMSLINRQDYEHPLIGMIYSEIGGYAMRNDNANLLRAKVKEIYSNCRAEIVENNYKMLTDQNDSSNVVKMEKHNG